MNKIWRYLKQHVAEDFHLIQYIALAGFIACGLTLNYAINLENSFLDRLPPLLRIVGFFTTYATAYYFALLTYSLFRKEKTFWSDRTFWRKSLLVLAVLSVDCSMPYVRETINHFSPDAMRYWIYKVGNNMMSQIFVMIPLLWYYYKYDRAQQHIYGLKPERFDFRPYFVMLSIMVPLVILASFEGSFGRQYPMYKTSLAHHHMGVPEWVPVGIYELVYGLDFVTVEFLFRHYP